MELSKDDLVVITLTRALLDKLTPDQRIAVFDVIAQGYCQHCGERQISNHTCNCQRDE